MAIIFEIEHTTTEAPSHPHVRSVKFKLNFCLCSTKKGPRSSKRRVPPSGNNRRVELSGRDRSAVQVKCQLNE